MAIKLIALDLDGTLLNDGKQISKANKAALQAAKDQGVKVVITTGRPLPAVEKYLSELDLIHDTDYSITFNGGLVQKNTGDILDKTGFGLAEVSKIREVTQELDLPLDIVLGGDVFVLESHRKSLYSTCNPLLYFIPYKFEDLSATAEFNKAITSCDADFLDQQIPKIPAEMHEHFEIFKSRELILEWCPKGVHKANGLEKLIAHLGIKRSEVMTCGDEDNDFTMIEWAGTGVAMANGSERVKAVADVVTPMSNNEDAVAWAVNKYVLGGR